MKKYEGNFDGKGLCIGIVVARFNHLVTKSLLEGAIDAFSRQGIESSNISVVWVPGAFEVPLAAKALAISKKYDAILCLGAVIRGATAHFDYVSSQVTSGVGRVALDTNVPIIFEVLTTDTIEQALERAGTKAGNKGFDAGMAAMEMVNLLRTLGK